MRQQTCDNTSSIHHANNSYIAFSIASDHFCSRTILLTLENSSRRLTLTHRPRLNSPLPIHVIRQFHQITITCQLTKEDFVIHETRNGRRRNDCADHRRLDNRAATNSAPTCQRDQVSRDHQSTFASLGSCSGCDIPWKGRLRVAVRYAQVLRRRDRCEKNLLRNHSMRFSSQYRPSRTNQFLAIRRHQKS